MKTEPNHDTMVALTELNYLKCFLLRCTNRYSRTTRHITKTTAKITLTAIRAFLYASSPFSVWRWGALFPVECSCKALSLSFFLVWAADVTILLEVVFVILLVVSVAVDCVGRKTAIKQENNDEIKHPYIYFCLALKITKNLAWTRLHLSCWIFLNFPLILRSQAATGGKSRVYVRPPADIREFKIRRLRTTNYGWTSVVLCL